MLNRFQLQSAETYPIQRRLLVLCSLLALVLPSCHARMEAGECLKAVKLAQTDGRPKIDCQQTCGQIDLPSDGKTFLERLSPQCRAVMGKYRRIQDTEPGSEPMHGFSSPPRCPKGLWYTANEVHIVQAPDSHGFAMCTIPKSGCSHFRLLFHAMMNFPEPLPYSSAEQTKITHFGRFLTIWDFETQSLPSDVFPSFTVGRNPYARLLSGFLDKMTLQGMKEDTKTRKYVNKRLGLDTNRDWVPRPEAFHAFVRMLGENGNPGSIDSHFGRQSNACGQKNNRFNFEYYLQIEDIAEWFPCWEHGLNLTSYTATGWQWLDQSEVWVGGNPAFDGRIYSDTQCWYKAPGFERCDQFYEETHPNWDTKSWGGLWGDAASAIPLDTGDSTRLDSRQRTKHDTGAAGKLGKWYNQEVADYVYDLYRSDFEMFGYERLVLRRETI